MNTPRAIPLLSGLPPDYPAQETSCRKCDKEFNDSSMLFYSPGSQSQKCNHCGYSYCSACSNYQALLPREVGYDPVAVCAYCIEYLTITAAGKSYLRGLPLSKLKKYLDAYNIKADGAIEKDDLVEIIMYSRGPNGCLSHPNEDYYRRYSVPGGPTNRFQGYYTDQDPQHPQLDPRPRERSSQCSSRQGLEPKRNPLPSPPRHSEPISTPMSSGPQPGLKTHPYAQYRPPASSSHPQQRPAARPSAWSYLNVPTPNTQTMPQSTSGNLFTSQPPPSLDRLLEMSPEDISSLPTSMLKSILTHNHVNARLFMEKTDLADKVQTIIDEEKRRRQRDAIFAERKEEAERARERDRFILEELKRELQARQEGPDSDSTSTIAETFQTSSSPEVTVDDTDGTIETAGEVQPPEGDRSKSPATPPKHRQLLANVERIGLCAVCQHLEEENIVTVDSETCSDLMMTIRPRIDLHESLDNNIVTATFELPGLRKEDVTIDVHDHVLNVSAETSPTYEKDDRGYVIRERKFGKFSRSLQIPQGIHDDNIKASMENGLLTVCFPKLAPKTAPRKITIN